MRTYSIGEVADMLGVKPHVIRYWEQEVPLLAPRKGLSGRREYTSRDLRLLLRLRHHLYRNRFTLEGARQQLWSEIHAMPPATQTLIAQVRDDLMDCWVRLRKLRG
jgi:DNA-binding transcriptional MerR regulator